MNIMMGISMKDCMRMATGMDLVSLHGQMGTHMKGTIKMTINMDMEYSDEVMETSGWATSQTTN